MAIYRNELYQDDRFYDSDNEDQQSDFSRGFHNPGYQINHSNNDNQSYKTSRNFFGTETVESYRRESDHEPVRSYYVHDVQRSQGAEPKEYGFDISTNRKPSTPSEVPRPPRPATPASDDHPPHPMHFEHPINPPNMQKKQN